MTDAPDLARRWSAWLDALAAAGYPARAMTRQPADPAVVAHAEEGSGIRFPDELRALYACCDGQYPSYPRGPGPHPPTTSLFPCYDLLSVVDALAQWHTWADIYRQSGGDMADFDEMITVRDDDPVHAVYWDLAWWPLAMDGGGNFLAVDTRPAPGGDVGQVIVAGADEDERRRLGTGLGDYLARLTAAPLPAPEPADPDDPERIVLSWDLLELR